MLLKLRHPEFLLLLMASAVPFAFSTWYSLINNFSIEAAGFNGAEFGMLHSLREVPGFLAFLVVFLLVLFREQKIALVSLLLLGVGTSATGFFPTVLGLYCTTVLMSVGFHYYETVQSSLALQWVPKERTPQLLGKLIAVGSFSSLLAFGTIFVGLELFSVSYQTIFFLGGGICIAIALFAWVYFPSFPSPHPQIKTLVMRRRYWLFYVLTFLSGARRQIFMVFAGFMMVEKFGYSASWLTMLFLVNCAINIWLAPLIGKLVGYWGERKTLMFEYIGLVGVFVTYAFVENAYVATFLYILDHLFFAMAIAIKTYFQKIADPADIASTAGVAFTINHIAAVVLPILLGLLWLSSPSLVFLCGAGFAFASLIVSTLIPHHPTKGRETELGFG